MTTEQSNNIHILQTNNLSQSILDKMFSMYQLSYTGDKWFKTPSDFLKYECGIITQSENIDNMKAFLLFQVRPKCNKLSLFFVKI